MRKGCKLQLLVYQNATKWVNFATKLLDNGLFSFLFDLFFCRLLIINNKYDILLVSKVTLAMGGTKMAVSYNKLWKLLIDRKMKKKDLIALSGVSKSTIAKMASDEHVSTETIAKICHALGCNVDNVMEIVHGD